ncbi:MAG: winged helix-turn-helix transcriptional regulator [Peptostreptococcaceae bacterium]|nr:MarR family winged helix-turn-helix transcriptional regulator [uncultured Criibacterium sp.]MBS6063226.1 winged helix-turn-helix transcriptional regulator [Peptostreptococcaceae bacterium]
MQDNFVKFSTQILSLEKIWHKLAAQEMDNYGLNSSHLSYLLELYNNIDGLSSYELSTGTTKDKSDVSRSLNFMIKQNIVEKTSVHKRGYAGKYHLTKKGIEIAEKVSRKVDFAVKYANEGIDEKEKEIFYRVLETFTDNIKALNENQKFYQE